MDPKRDLNFKRRELNPLLHNVGALITRIRSCGSVYNYSYNKESPPKVGLVVM